MCILFVSLVFLSFAPPRKKDKRKEKKPHCVVLREDKEKRFRKNALNGGRCRIRLSRRSISPPGERNGPAHQRNRTLFASSRDEPVAPILPAKGTAYGCGNTQRPPDSRRFAEKPMFIWAHTRFPPPCPALWERLAYGPPLPKNKKAAPEDGFLMKGGLTSFPLPWPCGWVLQRACSSLRSPCRMRRRRGSWWSC